MRHINDTRTADDWPRCGSWDPGDELVEAAFASDCNDCRTALGIGTVSDKGGDGKEIGVHPEPSYAPEPPLTDADGNIFARVLP